MASSRRMICCRFTLLLSKLNRVGKNPPLFDVHKQTAAMSESLAKLRASKSDFLMILGPGTDKECPYQFDRKAGTTAFSITGASTFHRASPDIASMPFLVIQIFHKANDQVRINLGVSTTKEPDEVKILSFSTDIRATRRASGPHARITLQRIPDNKWVNICFDLDTLVVQSCPGETFQALKFIEIHPSCLIRHIFAMTKTLKPENEGKDVPNKFRTPDSVTVCVSRNASPKSRKVHSQGLHKKAEMPSPKRAKTGAKPEKKPTTQESFGDDFILSDDDEEDDDSGEAFSGAPPQMDLPELDVKRRLPENEEEELELVYIEVLNCYYCPNNQQYYQIDSEE